MNLKKKQKITEVCGDYSRKYPDAMSYRKLKIPATGILMNQKYSKKTT